MSRDLFILTCSQFSLGTSVLKGGYKLGKSAKFEENEIMNRSSPILTYANSSAIVFGITLDLVALQSAEQEISQVVKTLFALVSPVQSGLAPPPLCQITVGTILQNWKCMCTNVDPQCGENGVWDVDDNNPMDATVALQFKGIELQSVDASSWVVNTNIQDIAVKAFPGSGN
jgi:hypothetical protein